MELPRVAQDDPAAPVHRLHNAADVHIHVAIFAKLANFAAVILQAHDREPAFVVRSAGRADVEETGSILQFHDIVNVR